MEASTSDTEGLSKLAKWGIGLSLGALLLPVLGFAAFVIGVALLIRSEIGPGLGILLLSFICASFGVGLAIGLMGG